MIAESMDYTPLNSPESIPTVFAWNDRDPDKLASIFDEDAELVNVTGLWWHDRKPIRTSRKTILSIRGILSLGLLLAGCGPEPASRGKVRQLEITIPQLWELDRDP